MQVAVDRYGDVIRHNPGISMFGSSPSQVSSTILTSHEGQQPRSSAQVDAKRTPGINPIVQALIYDKRLTEFTGN
jgi:hypothetical protein